MKYKVKVDLTLEDEELTDSAAATQAQRIKKRGYGKTASYEIVDE